MAKIMDPPKETDGTGTEPSDAEKAFVESVRESLYGTNTDLSNAQKASLALACVLKPLFWDENKQDKHAGDLLRRFAVVTRNMELGKVVFFGNFPNDQLDVPSFWNNAENVDEHDDPVWKMVLRSAALPPFFAPDGAYLDGGVSPFANPCYAAYVGVQRRLGWNPHMEPLRFYSVGTGYHNVPQTLADLDDTQLMSAMVDAMMQDINFLQHQIMKRQRDEGTVWYKRYNISFDKVAFEKNSILKENMKSKAYDFAELANTASGQVRELAAIGTAVGKISVEGKDFAEGPWLQNRRKEDTGFAPKSRRLLKDVTSHSEDPSVPVAKSAAE